MAKHRSVSQYGQMGRCGEQYRLQRVERVPEKQAAWLVQGNAVHTALEKFEKSFRQADMPQTIDWYNESWAEELVKAKEKQPDFSQWMTGGRK